MKRFIIVLLITLVLTTSCSVFTKELNNWQKWDCITAGHLNGHLEDYCVDAWNELHPDQSYSYKAKIKS